MDKIRIFVILFVVVLFAAFLVFDNDTSDSTNETFDKVITVSTDDPLLTGKLEITEYKDKEDINSQNGVTTEIQLNGGSEQYKLKNDTKYFEVHSGFVDLISLNTDNFDHYINVEYWVNGEIILSSSEKVWNNDCFVSFGGQFYSIDGEIAT